MNDFGNHLSTLLDEAAASIRPRPDFEAVRAASVPVVPTPVPGGRRFRSAFGVAAAAVALLGGGVAAYQVAGDDPDAVVTSTESTQVESDDVAETTVAPADRAPTSDRRSETDRPVKIVPAGSDGEHDVVTDDHADRFERTAELGDAELIDGVIHQRIHGRAAPGEFVTASSGFGSTVVAATEDGAWKLVVKLAGVPDGGVAVVRVSYARFDGMYEFEVRRPATPEEPKAEEPKAEEPKAEEPKAEPPKAEEPKPEEPKHEEPEPIAFTVKLASSYNDETHMKQTFYGTAPAGAVVYAQSEWGSTHVTAGPKGGWELHFVLADVPDDTIVHVVVSANTGGAFSYDLVRAKPHPEPEPEPEPVAFTAQLGEGHLGHSPMKQVLYGTGTPGSAVVARTEYGSADGVVGPKGHWEMVLKMYEVPGGTTVGVRVTNNESERVFEFSLQRPADEPESVDFTAQAAFETCNSNPPYNEYWGTSTAGTKITISSPYGGKQLTANGDGHWEARVEFPDAPVGETFIVTVASSQGGPVYEFPLTRTPAE